MTRYYLVLWITHICVCALGAFVTARKGMRSRPMLLATLGFIVIMFGSAISIIGDGIAQWLPLGPDFEDILYLFTNLWTVADLAGLFLIIVGIQLSFRKE